MKRTLIYLMISISSGTEIFCQTNNDPVYLNYTFVPNQKMKRIDASAALQIAEANLILPRINAGKKTGIYTNVNYRLSNYIFKTETETFPETLHDIRLSFIVRHQLTEKWEIILSPRANLRSDLSEQFSGYHLFPSLNILALKSSAPNLTWGFGATYNNDLNKNVFLPLTYLKYHNSKIRIYSILPSFAYILLTPNKRLEYGLSYNLDAAIFNVNRQTTDPQNYLKTLNVSLAPTIGYNFSKKFWLNAKLGYAMFRNFQLLNTHFNEFEITRKNRFNGGLVANIGLSMRLDN